MTAVPPSGPAAARGPEIADRRETRLMVLRVLVLALIVTLVGRLWYLQVRTGPAFREAAAANSVRTLVIPAVRGSILDDLGRPLADNRSALVLSVDQTVLQGQKDHGKAVLARVGTALGQSPQVLSEELRQCSAKLPKPCWNGSPYQPIPVARDITVQQALAVSEQRELFPGVTAAPEGVRQYPAPYGANAAQILGYLSPVTENEVTASAAASAASASPSAAAGPGLQRSDLIGRSGLESFYDGYLRGEPGVTDVDVDNLGRITATASTVAPHSGDYVVTNIDARVQAVAEQQLQAAIQRARSQTSPTDGHPYKADSAAVVVMDARTGRVVAMASSPTYDPNVWTGGISATDYAALTSASAGTPLISRAFQGQFAPGSTFKAVTTAAMLQDGYGTGSYDCSPSFAVGSQRFTNFEGEAFGPISLKRAIEVSCDTVFYGVAYQMWLADGGNKPGPDPKEPIATMARAFGLGRKTGIDLPGETSGDIQNRAEKLATWNRMKDIWCKRGTSGYPELEGSDPARAVYLKALAHENCVEGYAFRGGDAVISAIGQGGDLLSPLQLARTYAAVANGGTLYQPQIGRAVLGPDGKLVKDLPPIVSGHIPVSSDTIAFLQDALHGVATEGTGAPAFGGWPMARIPVGAKTGTAEVYGKQTTSCFVAYAGTATGPRYVVAMMVSQGGTGVGTSGPSVEKILEAIYGVSGGVVDPSAANLPNATLPSALPVIKPDGTLPALPVAPALPAPGSSASPGSGVPSVPSTPH